jgi:hypothetical protein
LNDTGAKRLAPFKAEGRKAERANDIKTFTFAGQYVTL